MATTIDRVPKADRTNYRRLEQLLRQQEVILRARKQILRDGLPDETAGVVDFAEHALDGEEQGVGFSVLALTSQAVRGIETALQRLAAGAYGMCAECGTRISAPRLQALPFAALCLVCQDLRDRAARGEAAPAAGHWEERAAWTQQGSSAQ
jgi:DnaK suppressor protein